MANIPCFPIPEITVTALAQKVAEEGDRLQLLDVREPGEWAVAKIEGFTSYPLSEFHQWEQRIFQDLDPQGETYVICHHGVRSANMCQWLQQQGFTNVTNIRGGIDAYSREVDGAIPRY